MRHSIRSVSTRIRISTVGYKSLCRRYATISINDSAQVEAPPSPAAGIRLRQYQEECIQSVITQLAKGDKRLGISLATGSGKTVIFTHLIERVPPPQPNATQTLILVHRRELVEQAASHCSRVYPNKTIEVEMGNLHASGTADITIASVQSINSKDRISKFDKDNFKLVLVDEAHHIVASGYMQTLDHFGLLHPRADSPALVGVSATMSRFDGLKLGSAIDHIVYHKDYVDMIGEKWLSDVIFTTVKSHADISKVKKGANGDFHPGDLSKAVNTAVTNDLTVRSWLARAMERRSTLVFCVDLAHVSGLTETFRKHGIEARYVTGETPKKLRSERLDAFRNHEFPVLVNCGVFTEGTDIPNIDCVLLARPTRSRNLLVQMIGRGMRLYPRKANCHIIDMVASLETGIVTTPTLFGLDPAELMVAASMADIQKIKDEKVIEMKKITSPRKEAEATPSLEARGGSRVTFTDYDSVFDLLNDSSGDAHIRALSPLAWVEVGGHRYILSTQGGDYITLDKERDDFYVVRETRKLFAVSKNAAPYMPPRELATAITFQDAVHAADTYAQEAYPWRIVSKDQDWRRKPASENQLKFLNKLRDKHNPLAETDITKGKAADMITKIKHGARGRFSKLSVEKRKVVRRVERAGQMEALKEREQVKVGPVAD